MNKKYSLVSSNWDNKEISAINKVIKSGLFTIGKQVNNFEKNFSTKFKIKYSVMVNSGSSANLIAIYSLFFKKKNPLKVGDEVIVPGVAWSTTYAPLKQLGLNIKIIDINKKTLNLDINLLKKNITKKTRLIIGVSILGNPVDLENLNKICRKNNIYLMEDNCESLGAKIKNRYTGTYGIVNTNSFFFSHHINTIEGGMISTDNEEIYHILLCLREHGWTRRLPNSKYFKKSNLYQNYRFVLPGFNLRPTEINGAIGIVQLKKFNEFINIRRNNLKVYYDLFTDNKYFDIQEEFGHSSAFSFVFVLKNEFKNRKNKIINLLTKNNIEFRLITGGSVSLHPYIKFFSDKKLNLINSEYIHKYGFFTGNHSIDLSSQLRNLKNTIEKL